MKEELIFNRSDGMCEFGKVSYTMRKNGDWFGAFCKSYPQFSRILDDTDIVGDSSHPYASSIPLMNEKEAIFFYGSPERRKGRWPSENATGAEGS